MSKKWLKTKSKSSRHSRSKRRRSQKGGAILTPATYSNSGNAHFSGIGFTDPTGAVTGCTGGGASNIYTTIGGIKTPVTMKGGRRRRSCPKCSRRNCTCKKYRVLIAINSSAHAKIKVECVGGGRNAVEIRTDIQLAAFI